MGCCSCIVTVVGGALLASGEAVFTMVKSERNVTRLGEDKSKGTFAVPA